MYPTSEKARTDASRPSKETFALSPDKRITCLGERPTAHNSLVASLRDSETPPTPLNSAPASPLAASPLAAALKHTKTPQRIKEAMVAFASGSGRKPPMARDPGSNQAYRTLARPTVALDTSSSLRCRSTKRAWLHVLDPEYLTLPPSMRSCGFGRMGKPNHPP